MATIVSDYSLQLAANVPADILAPKPVVLGQVTAEQILTGEVNGKSVITLNWTLPTENEIIGGELLGVATGAAQVLETAFDPIVAASYSIYEMSAAVGGSGYGDSTLSAEAKYGKVKLNLVSGTNFVANDWAKLVSGSKVEFVKIASVSTNELTLVNPLQDTYPVGTTVQEVNTVALKTETTQYTVNLSTGQVTLVAGQFTNGASVVATYTTTLQDADHIEIYRDNGKHAIADPDYDTVKAHSGIVIVNNNVNKTAVQYIETLTAAENGEDWTYYVFMLDDETVPNPSAAAVVPVETLPGVPQHVTKEVGENRVLVSWDALTDNPLSNGYNVYRCTTTWIDANAVKLNSALITDTSFEDSALNVTNRRPSGEVAYPVNGTVYVYKVESEDTTTDWSTGVVNPQFGDTGNGIASKSA